MIITGKKALTIVSSHAVIIGGVQELLDVVEMYAQRRRDWNPKKKCGGCDEIAFFQGVETAALQKIEGLGPDPIARLKKFLGAKDLWINTATPGKPSSLKKLH